MKSSFSPIVISFTSGLQITQFGFPPKRVIFASASPIVLETDNFPGKTLNGPKMRLKVSFEELLVFI
jgi:hypothetical protein